MKDLQIFNYQDTPVRTVLVDDEPWFVAADLVGILEIGRVHDAVRGLDDDEKGADTIRTPGGDQQATIVNEAGMYSLVLRSRKPEAKTFRRWITHEVLPSIRRTGSYGQANVVALPSRSALAQMVLDAEKELGEAQSTIEAQKPIVSYHDKFVAERDDIITVDNFASQYGSTGPKVRALLKEKGIAVRRAIGARWSDSAGCMVEEFEWRPRQGLKSQEWFELRPQHNAPRLHNGQVRQTMYVLQFRADDLAARLGLIEPQMLGGDAA